MSVQTNIPAGGNKRDDSAAEVGATTKRRAEGVTARAVIIGLLCGAALCAITPYNDFKIGATYIAGTQFPIGAIVVLLLLSGVVNVILRKIKPAAAFVRSELLTIWAMIVVTSGLPSSGLMRYFLPNIVAAPYFSDSTNHWEKNVWSDIPQWLRIHDMNAVNYYYKGFPAGTAPYIPWAAWGPPLFFWGLLAVFFICASFCLASLMRRHWVENEKFVFPLVTLPVLLSEEPKGKNLFNDLLRSPVMWLAFALVTALHTTRGLHMLFPTIPDITMQWTLNDYLQVPPWNHTGWFPAVIYPLVIGFTYLLSTEVCFSLWFFFLAAQFENVLAGMYNYDMPGTIMGYGSTTFHSLQAFGGAVALVFWTLRSAQPHLRDVWEKARGGPRASQIDDSDEMISYRGTVIGLVLSFGGICLWLYAAKVSVVLIALTMVVMFVGMIVVSWFSCQAGMIISQMPNSSLDLLGPTVGTAPFSIGALYTQARVEALFMLDTREMLMPSLLNGVKTSESAKFSTRSLTKAMALSVFVGLIVAAVASLALPYYNGGAHMLKEVWGNNMAPQLPIKFLSSAASTPYKGHPTNFGTIMVGFAGVLALLMLRARTGIALHPIGYLCAATYPMHALWFSIFIGWMLKMVIQRYGGRKGYLALLPFFLGLILADAFNAVIWIILGYVTKVGYQIMPG